jgi:hypothetical protein
MTEPRTLTLSTGSFDRENTFSVAIPGRPYACFSCSLHRDYKKVGDGVLWIMQHASSIVSHESDERRDERLRLLSEEKVYAGQTVIVDGAQYTVRVLGDYSDCAILDRVAA